LPRGATPELDAALRGFRRQALHAEHLAFAHPVTGAALAFDAVPPRDFLDLLDLLREDASHDQT
jgi:23S rRNA pseudouridine1911/1915/1917 synthase